MNKKYKYLVNDSFIYNNRVMVSRLKICVFAPEVHDSISKEVLSGILLAATTVDIDVTIICAGSADPDKNYIEDKSHIYRGVFNKYKFNGVIVLAGSMSNFATIDEMQDLLSFIPKTIPVVNISVKIPGYHAILSDNFTPIKTIVDHLITKHNKKRIMFIKGPSGQSEAEDRFRGYCASLDEFGLILDEQYIFPGNFTPHLGADAIKQLIESKVELPDAIVCVDDDTALGVYSELKRQKINILEQNISVTGFDNMGYTKTMVPPLTTVDQLFSEHGKLAVEALVVLLRGGIIEDKFYNPKIIFRDSCGSSLSERELSEKNENFIGFISNRVGDVHIDGFENHIDDIAHFLNKFVEDQEYNFVSKIEEYIARYKYKGYNLTVLIEVIHILSESIISKLNRENLISFYKYIGEINLSIISSINNEKVKDSRVLIEQSSEFESVLMRLATSMSYKELESFLDINFYYLGIKSISLVFNNSKISSLQLLSGRKFIKDDSLNRSKKIYCSLVLPITTKSESGYCIFEILLNSFHIGEVLAFQISRALYQIELFNNLNIKLDNIEGSYIELRTTKDLLMQNEKMANIGGLVAGFTHEIGTPISVSVTAISHIVDEIKVFKDLFYNGSVKKSEMSTFIDSADETSKIVLNNLKKTASLINGFKQISVDQASEVKRTFEIRQYLNEIILSLKPILRRGRHTVDLIVKETIVLDSYPGAISQIITNLVQNSIKHGFENIKDGNINISVYKENKTIVINYYDNGCGISKNLQNIIFEPYFSTKIGKGGSGLGLSIIKKLTEERLHGSIVYNNDFGPGAGFIISIPI